MGDDLITGYRWYDKLGRGAGNVVGFPIEIARSIQKRGNEKRLGYAWAFGLVGGVGQGLIRLGAGVIEIATFPFDFPEEDKAPLLLPEYAWQDVSAVRSVG